MDCSRAAYIYEEKWWGSVISPKSPGSRAAATQIGWTGSRFSAHDDTGRSLSGRSRLWGLVGPWSVTDGDEVLLQVAKPFFGQRGNASLRGGEALTIRGDSESGVLVTDARGGVVIHMSPESGSTRRSRRLSLMVSEDHLSFLEAVCLVQAWRLLDTSRGITDPSYSAAQSGSYT